MKTAKLTKIFGEIRLLALDFDGVMTDGRVYISERGEESVRCSKRDSMGIRMLLRANVDVAVFSGETNAVVRRRCAKLGIRCFDGLDGGAKKVAALSRYARERGISPEQVCFIGDDVNDVECLFFAGIGVAVADGIREIKRIADYVTKNRGGDRAVREVCDMILTAQKRRS